MKVFRGIYGRFGVVLFLSLTLFSCKKLVQELTTFTVTNSIRIPVPEQENLDVESAQFGIDSVFQFDNFETSSDLVQSITLEHASISVITPENQTLSPINDIQFYIVDQQKRELLLAWEDNIPNSVGRVVELQTASEDISRILEQDAFKLRTEAEIDDAFVENTELEVVYTFEVTAGLKNFFNSLF